MLWRDSCPPKFEAEGLIGHHNAEGGDAVSFETAGFVIGALALAIACISFGYQIGKDVNQRK